MKKAKPTPPLSNLDVLAAISDQLSMDIVTATSNDVTNSDNLMQVLDLTRKQYYSRSSRLMKIGIISRKNGDIILTSFGQLVYKAQLKIATAFSHFGIEDDRCNKITLWDVRRRTKENNRQTT